MRVLVLAVLAGCTIGSRGPDPVTARPPPDPDRMPSAVLDRQDPAADTSQNPVLARTSARYRDPEDSRLPGLGCLRLLACDASSGGGTDVSAALVVLAALAATRRRNTS